MAVSIDKAIYSGKKNRKKKKKRNIQREGRTINAACMSYLPTKYRCCPCLEDITGLRLLEFENGGQVETDQLDSYTNSSKERGTMG